MIVFWDSRGFLGRVKSLSVSGDLWENPITCGASSNEGAIERSSDYRGQLTRFSPNEGSKTSGVLVQSQLKGVNKVILSEGGAIPARSEMVIEGKIQTKDISQVGMISASRR